MKKPANLKSNDKIAVIAPSFGVAEDPYKTRYLRSKKNFQNKGYEILEGQNVYLGLGVASSNSPQERAKEFMEAYQSDASTIISVGGGELMCDILPFVDFELIKTLPAKMFMGFSDNANLTFTLTTIAEIQSIYGPNFPSFYERPWRLNQLDAMKMLQGETHFEGYPKWRRPIKKKITDTPLPPINPLARTRYMAPKIIKPYNYQAPFEGMLLGGCLDCLINLCGTKFDNVSNFIEKYKDDGFIWYLEACDLNPLSIRRALFQLKQAGWFKYAKGFLIGRPLCHEQEIFGVDKYNAVTDILGGFNLPILMDIDLGHYAPSMPMKNGAKATISYIYNNIVIDYK